jgi:hypothetical protein
MKIDRSSINLENIEALISAVELALKELHSNAVATDSEREQKTLEAMLKALKAKLKKSGISII